MDLSLDTFGEEQIYNFERIGSFGRFYSGESFPIEYIMTNFSSAELSELTFARDIRPDQIDFELLIQRDIDEERVRLEMEPYLNPNSQQLTLAEIKTRSVFFPPLLAAIVPTKGKTMQTYYTDEQGEITLQPNGKEYIIREWPGLFKLTYFSSISPHAYCLPFIDKDNKITQVSVQCEPVQLKIRLAKGHQTGAKLVIIDGQHRLFTLRQVYEKKPELIDQLGVPVCILFAPYATEQKNREYAPYRIPTVPEVFRHLFVDVNNTAKQVGGHFSILLADNTLSSIACRKFCDHILNHWGAETLAVIEWNTKAKKESAKILRAYSITSIGIIDKALEESIGNRKLLIKYLLNLEEVKTELYPNGDDGEIELDYPIVKWNKFSLSQKNILEQQIKKYLIPCLEFILLTPYQFNEMIEIFKQELKRLKILAHTEQPETFEARQVINQIVDYMPIGDGKSFEGVRLMYRNFEAGIKKAKEEKIAPIFQYALFQRAIFESWAQLLDLTRTMISDPLATTKGFVKLLDFASQNKGQFFIFERLYMQHTVFAGTQIIVREETKKMLAQLVMTHLAPPLNAKSIASEIGLKGKNLDKLAAKLEGKGKAIMGEFPKHYEIARKRTFKANYRIYLSLSGEERQALAKAEEEQKKHLQEVKEGKRTKTEVSEQFDQLIHKHVESDIQLAVRALEHQIYGTEE